MKFSAASSLAMLASLVAAVPTPTLQDRSAPHRRTMQKRATVTDACDVGFGTQNGGYAVRDRMKLSGLADGAN